MAKSFEQAFASASPDMTASYKDLEEARLLARIAPHMLGSDERVLLDFMNVGESTGLFDGSPS